MVHVIPLMSPLWINRITQSMAITNKWDDTNPCLTPDLKKKLISDNWPTVNLKLE